MILFTSDNTSQANDTYVRKNLAYVHETRTVTSGGGGGPAFTLTGFEGITGADITGITQTDPIFVRNNFTGVNIGSLSAIIDGTNRNTLTTTTVPNTQFLTLSTTGASGFNANRLGRSQIAEALNIADADAFDETGLDDANGHPILIRFGTSTIDWQLIGIATRNLTGANAHGIIWVLPPSAQANLPNTTIPDATTNLSTARYMAASTTAGLQSVWTFGGFNTGLPDPEAFTIDTTGGTTAIQINVDSVPGTVTPAQLNMIAAGQNIIILNQAADTEIARGVVDTSTGISFGATTVTINMVMPSDLTTAGLVDFTDYTILFGPDAAFGAGGGGGGLSFTINDGNQDRFTRKLNEIARGDFTIV